MRESEAGVFPLSPVPRREFAYSHTQKHDNLDTSDCSWRTREINLLNRPSPPRVTSTLSAADIAAACPARRIPEAEQKRWRDPHNKCGSLTTGDIIGAQPHCRHVKLRNKPDTVYSCRDIHRAYPWLKPALSDRMVDPMMPVYKFPSTRPGPPVVHMAGATPLEHPRKLPNCGDIDGASPSLRFMTTPQRISSFLQNDVQTKRPRKEIRNRRSPLDIQDIMTDPAGAGHVFRSTRVTNTLDPRYDWDRPTNWDAQTLGRWEIGGYDGEKPRTLMNSHDAPKPLHGKQLPPQERVPDTCPMELHSLQLGRAAEAFRRNSRREVRHTNHIADIQGAQADSVETAMRTNRVTDPLQPQYTWSSYEPNMGSDRYVRTPDRVMREACVTPTPATPPPPPEPVNPPRSNKELNDALDKVKYIFHERGAYAGRALARVIRHFDDGDGQINVSELRSGLQHYLGQEFNTEELDHIVQYFDRDQGGTITVEEFLHGIRGNLSANRMEVVTGVFDALDRDSSSEITLNEIEANFDVSNHPKVISGELSRDEALEEFLLTWDANADGGVTKQEFIDYFKDVSLGIEDDEKFHLYMAGIFPEIIPHLKSQAKVTKRRATPYSKPSTSGL